MHSLIPLWSPGPHGPVCACACADTIGFTALLASAIQAAAFGTAALSLLRDKGDQRNWWQPFLVVNEPSFLKEGPSEVEVSDGKRARVQPASDNTQTTRHRLRYQLRQINRLGVLDTTLNAVIAVVAFSMTIVVLVNARLESERILRGVA